MSIISILSPGRSQLTASKPLLNILHQIKTGLYQKEIEAWWQQLDTETGKPDPVKNTSIPWFTAAGHFKQRKRSLELISYSGFLIFEIIYVLESDQEVVRETLRNNPYVYAVFKNAAGTGLHFIVKIGDHYTNHQSNFWKVKSCFQEYLDTQRISIKGEALDYFTQFSWDPDLYMNLEASAYPN